MRKINILFTILLLIAISASFANSKEQERIYRGIRSLGMGNAFVAVADKHSALQHNVAGLTQVKGRDFVMLDLVVMANDDFRKAYFDDGIGDLMNSTEVQDFDANQIDKLYQYDLTSKFGTQILGYTDHVNQTNHYSFGIYGITNIAADVDRDVLGIPIVEYDVETSFVAMGGYARDFSLKLPFFDDSSVLTTGLAIKYYNIGRLKDTRHSIEIVGYGSSDIPKWDGQGFGFDFGLMYSFWHSLNFGLAIHDIGSTRIDYKDNPNDIIPPNVRWGVAYRPSMKNVPLLKSLLLSFEWRDFLNEQETSFGEKIHLGFETYITRFLGLRAGFNQGYPTLGCSLDWQFGGIEYAFYGIELGDYVGQHQTYTHALQLRLLNF